MNNQQLQITVEDERWLQALPEVEDLSSEVADKVLAWILSHEDLDLFHLNLPLFINLSLSNDEQVRSLNKEYRGLDKSTNVLSFANIDDEDFLAECELYDEIQLGDIIIALKTMQREAAEQEVSFRDHYCHLLVHGLLHILGYDHMEAEEAAEMEACEAAILQLMNIKNPYED